MIFPIKDLFSIRDQIRSFPRIWSHLLRKSLMKNSFFAQSSIKTVLTNLSYLAISDPWKTLNRSSFLRTLLKLILFVGIFKVYLMNLPRVLDKSYNVIFVTLRTIAFQTTIQCSCLSQQSLLKNAKLILSSFIFFNTIFI